MASGIAARPARRGIGPGPGQPPAPGPVLMDFRWVETTRPSAAECRGNLHFGLLLTWIRCRFAPGLPAVPVQPEERSPGPAQGTGGVGRKRKRARWNLALSLMN